MTPYKRTTYRVDIGTWREGNVVIIRAKNIRHCLRLAKKHLPNGEETEGTFIVQVVRARDRKYLYDYMNCIYKGVDPEVD